MIIAHRCQECGHLDISHDASSHKGRSCSFSWCPCSQVRSQVVAQNEPTVIATLGQSNQPTQTILQPGSDLDCGIGQRVRLCGCDACHAHFATLGGAA